MKNQKQFWAAISMGLTGFLLLAVSLFMNPYSLRVGVGAVFLFGGAIGSFLGVAISQFDEMKKQQQLEEEHEQHVRQIIAFYREQVTALELPGLARPITRDEFNRMWGSELL